MFQSVVHILLETIGKHPGKAAFLYKKNGEYVPISYREFGEQTECLTHGLAALGLNPGDRISILSYNRPEWPMTDFAVFAMRGIVVPVYHTLPANQIAYILKDAGVRAIFVEDRLQFDKIKEIWDQCPDLQYVIAFSEVKPDGDKIISFADLLKKGEAGRKSRPDFFRQSVDSIRPRDICSLVYTSGTTGHPKGVMLHHQGFVVDIVNSEAVLDLQPEDVFLSFLPLSHLYERLGGHWCALYKGCTIGYATDISTVVDDLQKVRPTVMVSVPRLYEKISSGVVEQVEAGPAIKQKMFYWALKTGRKYHEKRLENRLTPLLRLKYKTADRVVFSKIKQKLGGRFRFPISGGAPLSTETLKFFEAIGLRIVEGYGMTETHLIITLTPPGKTRYGSCGKPIGEVEVKTGEDGEILVRGVTVMDGYFEKPELTAEVIDEEGWLHTGDVGYLDEDHYLYITDRKKNILVTAGGKNVAPAPIEHALKRSRYIDEVCLVGDQRKFISAIVVPNYENLKKWSAENNAGIDDPHKLVKDDAVIEMMMEEVESMQSDFARYEKVKKIALLPEPLTVENGELTPSLKVKRRVVEERYRDRIAALYRNLQ